MPRIDSGDLISPPSEHKSYSPITSNYSPQLLAVTNQTNPCWLHSHSLLESGRLMFSGSSAPPVTERSPRARFDPLPSKSEALINIRGLDEGGNATPSHRLNTSNRINFLKLARTQKSKSMKTGAAGIGPSTLWTSAAAPQRHLCSNTCKLI